MRVSINEFALFRSPAPHPNPRRDYYASPEPNHQTQSEDMSDERVRTLPKTEVMCTATKMFSQNTRDSLFRTHLPNRSHQCKHRIDLIARPTLRSEPRTDRPHSQSPSPTSSYGVVRHVPTKCPPKRTPNQRLQTHSIVAECCVVYSHS